MGKARSMRAYAKLPPPLWDEMYLTATHTHVRTGTSTLEDATPFEKWYGRKPDISYLCEIGCRAFVLILSRHNPKLYERSIEYVLVGYDDKSKTYRCYDKTTQQIYSSYHVRFIENHEESFPLSKPGSVPHTTPSSLRDIVHGASSTPIYHNPDDEEEYLPTEPTTLPTQPQLTPTDPPQAPVNDASNSRRSARIAQAEADKAARKPSRHDIAVQESREAGERVKAARAERKKTLDDIRQEEEANDPKRLEDAAIQDLCNAFDNINIDANQETTAEDIWDRILAAITKHAINPRDIEFEDDPKDWNDAKTSRYAPQWESAYRDELKSLQERGVYILVPRESIPNGTKIRKCRPIFKIKRDGEGKIDRFKVRVVFKGFEQVYGRDYTNTTSPTARMESWRILLHIGACLGWDARQIDVKTAFLYGLLPEDEVQYMEQLEGFFEPGKETWVWKLQRGLYGMKQSGRIWNKTMNDAMLTWGFTKLSSEPCIYHRKTDTGTIITTVHVDDFLSIAHPPHENDTFEKQMRSLWEISTGPVKFCIGIAIAHDLHNHTVRLSQTTLIDKVISLFGQSDAHPVTVPMDPGLKLRRPDPKDITSMERAKLNKLPYRSLVGCLLYLAIGTRPDISYAIQQLSQFLDSYTYAHWNAAIQVVKYLKGTRSLALQLGGKGPIQLLGFTDSDWANCLDTRKSVGGYGFTLGSGLVSWMSKKQSTIATSTCQAEYMAAFDASKEALFL
ncbi:hypothetical protein NLJ89_g10707 [Agrocybe chaxingu]|uniref:Reverse transcriptase Ty1/copia-type domain-containing protein n=1 Tax=Agrocybe chaxingu TaxID=84603 RepID=A0A9W8MQ15_9AGAR|nr:hypothetical protein NLJ89_g10707 [Agrocybe chaxingu]